MNLTLNFKELNRNNADIAGGKGASLGEMTQARIPVPPGFVVLSTTFDEFIKEADLVQEIDAILDKVDHKEIHTVENASEKIQALIKNAVMSERIATEIKKQFKELNTEFVAVRSSATAEDGAENAWAGQLDSFLNTKEANLLEKVQHCWASLFTPRAIFYRFEKGLHTTHISVAVVVQKMVNSEVSGIAFSVHPVTEDRNQLIIEAGFGLGEAIVSGSVTPDSYVVEKEPRNILDVNVSDQTRGLYRIEGGGSEWQELGEKGKEQVLKKEQILELSEIIIGIEKHYGFPCDIEWAYEAGRFYIVQSRPITTLSDNFLPLDEEKIITRSGPIKESVEVDYNVFIEKYKKEKWIKVGSWKVPLLSLSIFYSSQSDYYLNQYEIGDISPVTYFSSGSDVYVSESGLQAIKDRIFAKIDTEGLKIIESLDKKLSILREDLRKTYYNFINSNNLSYSNLLNLFEKLLVILSSFEILRDMSNYLEESIMKRFEEISITPVPLPELLERETESDISKFNQKLHSLSTHGYNTEDLKKLVNEFGYLNQYFLSGNGYTLDDIESEIKKHKSEEVGEQRHNFHDKKLNELIRIMNRFALVRLLNNESGNKMMYSLKPTFEEISNKYNISYKNLVGLPLDQFLNTMKGENTSFIGVDVIDICLISTDKDYILKKEDVQKFRREYLTEDIGEIEEISGTPTYKGIVRGTVRVILGHEDFVKFKQSDILICSMTDPNYVPLMKKASAFVTDIGGILCHAAIISRELKKPCIIGTKIATKVLKDGDMVEVNANNGIVKILK